MIIKIKKKIPEIICLIEFCSKISRKKKVKEEKNNLNNYELCIVYEIIAI